MQPQPAHYVSFLVRIWQEIDPEGHEPAGFRAEVEHIQSGARHFFLDAAALAAFLSQEQFKGKSYAQDDR